MRVAAFQGPMAAGDAAANLDVLERVTAEAAAQGALLLVAPEMFLTGYAIGPEAVRRQAATSRTKHACSS